MLSDLFDIYGFQWIYFDVKLVSLLIIIISLIVFIASIIKKKSKKSKVVPAITVVVMLPIFLFSSLLFSLSNTGEFESLLNPDVGFAQIWSLDWFVERNAVGKKVVYDKEGNEYSYKEYVKGFKYWDKDGNEYTLVTTNPSTQTQQLTCDSTGEIYDIPERPLFPDEHLLYVDENGYLFVGTDSALEEVYNDGATYYKDENGKLYYEWSYVGWNSKGKMMYYDTPISELSQYDIEDIE